MEKHTIFLIIVIIAFILFVINEFDILKEDYFSLGYYSADGNYDPSIITETPYYNILYPYYNVLYPYYNRYIYPTNFHNIYYR